MSRARITTAAMAHSMAHLLGRLRRYARRGGFTGSACLTSFEVVPSEPSPPLVLDLRKSTTPRAGQIAGSVTPMNSATSRARRARHLHVLFQRARHPRPACLSSLVLKVNMRLGPRGRLTPRGSKRAGALHDHRALLVVPTSPSRPPATPPPPPRGLHRRLGGQLRCLPHLVPAGFVTRGPAPRNIARDSRVELVVYDSSRLPGETAAVYMTGTAVEVSSDELEAACARRSLHVRERPVVRHRHGHPSGRSAGLSPLTG